MKYSSLNGGKYIRALLVYATGETLGINEKFLDQPAIAIELTHAYTLIPVSYTHLTLPTTPYV